MWVVGVTILIRKPPSLPHSGRGPCWSNTDPNSELNITSSAQKQTGLLTSMCSWLWTFLDRRHEVNLAMFSFYWQGSHWHIFCSPWMDRMLKKHLFVPTFWHSVKTTNDQKYCVFLSSSVSNTVLGPANVGGTLRWHHLMAVVSKWSKCQEV